MSQGARVKTYATSSPVVTRPLTRTTFRSMRALEMGQTRLSSIELLEGGGVARAASPFA
jgi:hypothetical protein